MANPLLDQDKPKPPTPFNVDDARAYIENQYQNLLGRASHPDGMNNLLVLAQQQGPQAVRQNMMGSEEYLTRMFGPSNSPWQTAARQATSNQAMMPGSFFDYANPLLTNPAEAQKLFSPTNVISKTIFDALSSIDSEYLKNIVPKDEEDEKNKKKGAPQGSRFTPNPEGETFFDRVRGY